MFRFFLGTKNITRTVLIVAGLSLWLYAWRHQIENGWFDWSDLFPFLGGSVLIAIAFFPATVRINVIVFIGLMIILEGIAAMLLPNSPQDQVTGRNTGNVENRSTLHYKDSNMGHKLVANNRVSVRRVMNDKLIYEYTATTDSFGRRITPIPERKQQNGFVAFFGASFTFGLGVDDDKTLPYFVGANLIEYKVYNYGVNAYGTQHLPALMNERDLRKEFDGEYGIGVYVFINDHVRRATYTLRRKASHQSPYYALDDESGVIRKGNFHLANPVLSRLYRDVLSRSKLLELMGVDLPAVDDEDILRTCRLIEKARHRFTEQFKKSEFYVIFHPSHYGDSTQYTGMLRACLEQSGVPYLDYSNEPWSEELNIPGDAHPNELGHRRLADLIAPQLRQAMKKLDQSH